MTSISRNERGKSPSQALVWADVQSRELSKPAASTLSFSCFIIFLAVAPQSSGGTSRKANKLPQPPHTAAPKTTTHARLSLASSDSSTPEAFLSPSLVALQVRGSPLHTLVSHPHWRPSYPPPWWLYISEIFLCIHLLVCSSLVQLVRRDTAMACEAHPP